MTPDRLDDFVHLIADGRFADRFNSFCLTDGPDLKQQLVNVSLLLILNDLNDGAIHGLKRGCRHIVGNTLDHGDAVEGLAQLTG